jgi:hypothetical protein
MIPTVLRLFEDILALKNDVNVSSNSVLRINVILVLILIQ